MRTVPPNINVKVRKRKNIFYSGGKKGKNCSSGRDKQTSMRETLKETTLNFCACMCARMRVCTCVKNTQH